MALTADNYLTVTVTMQDLNLNKSDISVKLPAATTLAQAQAFLATLVTALDAISNAIVRATSISISSKETDPAVAAVEASDVERKGLFSFAAANNTPLSLQVPSIDTNFVINFTNLIDREATEVAAFIDLIVNGNGTVAPVSNAGSSVAIFRNAKQIHRGSSKG